MKCKVCNLLMKSLIRVVNANNGFINTNYYCTDLSKHYLFNEISLNNNRLGFSETYQFEDIEIKIVFKDELSNVHIAVTTQQEDIKSTRFYKNIKMPEIKSLEEAQNFLLLL